MREKKRPRAFKLLIKFKTSGHEGLDSARHCGVNGFSHEQLSHTHTVAGQDDSASPMQVTSEEQLQLQPWSLVKKKTCTRWSWSSFILRFTRVISTFSKKKKKNQSKAVTCLTTIVLSADTKLYGQLQSSVHHQHLSCNVRWLQKEKDRVRDILWPAKSP